MSGKQSIHYCAMFPNEPQWAGEFPSLPQKWRSVFFGQPYTLSIAKGQVTRILNRGGSHCGVGAVGIARGTYPRIEVLSVKRDGEWHDCDSTDAI